MSAVFLTFTVSMEAEAVASYTRQTGQSCSACHFQHYPLLNEFGRAFKTATEKVSVRKGETTELEIKLEK